MKKLVLLLVLLPTVVFSQAITDTLSYRIDYTNYCLYRFQKQNLIALGTQLTGVGIITAGAIIYSDKKDGINSTYSSRVLSASDIEKRVTREIEWKKELDRIEKDEKITYAVGGAFILGGGILHVLSYQWLRNAYFVPIENGLAVRINF